MSTTLDQFDTIHMCLRRAIAISRLIAESSENKEQIEIPADTICAATYLVVELLDTVQQVLRETRDVMVEDGTPQGVETQQG